MKTRRIYGWKEQNECCWGIESMEVEWDCIEVGEDSELYGSVPEGRWFSTFSAAKKAAMKKWQSTIHVAKCALRDIRKATKSNIYNSGNQGLRTSVPKLA